MDQASPPPALPRPGERWVVRRRLPDGSATDVVGWVISAEHGRLRLETSTGPEQVAAVDVIAARRLPAARGGPDPRRTSAAELEHLSVPGWAAVTRPLGQWTLRAAGGFTARANSCHAVGDPGMEIAEAAARIVEFASEQGIAPWAQVIVGSREDRALSALGWRPVYVTTDVGVCRLADLLGDSVVSAHVTLAETLTEEWLALYRRSRLTPPDESAVRALLTGGPPRVFAAARTEGEVVGIARGHLSRAWLGIASVWIEPEHRGRGWGRKLVLALGHWAARRGARYGYVQVAADSSAAAHVYARLGFAHHHSYRVLAAP